MKQLKSDPNTFYMRLVWSTETLRKWNDQPRLGCLLEARVGGGGKSSDGGKSSRGGRHSVLDIKEAGHTGVAVSDDVVARTKPTLQFNKHWVESSVVGSSGRLTTVWLLFIWMK